MIFIIKLVGLFIILVSAMYIWKPDTIKKTVDFWAKNKRIYTAAFINIFLSVIFLLNALKCRLPWIIALIGILSLLKGILAFVLGPEKFIAKTNVLLAKSEAGLRFMGICSLIIGLLIIYAV